MLTLVDIWGGRAIKRTLKKYLQTISYEMVLEVEIFSIQRNHIASLIWTINWFKNVTNDSLSIKKTHVANTLGNTF